MRVSISTEGDFVSAHFGRCPLFTIIDVEDGQVVKKEIVKNPGHEPGAIPQFLHQKGVKCIICGGMGTKAVGFFNDLGMEAIAGVTGRVNEVIKKLLNGTLEGGESLCEHDSGEGHGTAKSQHDHK